MIEQEPAVISVGPLELSGGGSLELLEFSKVVDEAYHASKNKHMVDPLLDLVVDLCTNVSGSMSDEMLHRAFTYIHEKFLMDS